MDDRAVLRVLATPQDAGLDGRTVAPGRLLEWIDRAGYACAVGFAKAYCVTAYVGDIRFTEPVRSGDLVTLEGRIIQTGRASMQIRVTVDAAETAASVGRRAMECVLVFVALDDDRRPRAVPAWSPHDAAGIELERRAEDRLEARKVIRDAMMAQAYSDRGTTPQSKLRFLAAPGDANWGGNAHGGTVMRWIHEAAWSVAASWSSASAVAIYSGGMHFLKPIRIGSVVEVDARLILVTDDVMHISTRVSSAPAEQPAAVELTTVCMNIYAVPDGEGGRKRIAPLQLVSDEDRRLGDHALELVALRAALPPL